MKALWIAAAAVAVAVAGAPAAAQDDFPSRAVTVVVPYSAGGDSDLQARLVADGLSKELGQPVIVENKPGAGTSLGTSFVLDRPADGYTILVTSHALIATAHGLANPGYEIADFTPLGLVSVDANILLATDKVPSANLGEFLEYAKANSGAINFGSLSPSGNGQMLSVRLTSAAGFEWTGLPYDGDQEALLALLRGEVHGYFGGASTAIPLNAEESVGGPLPKLNFLAIASRERSAAVPDVPTFTELGYPDMVEESWTAVYVRTDTPAPIVEKLRAAMANVIKSPALVDGLSNLRLSQFTGTLEEFEEMMASKGERVQAHMEAFNIEKR